MLFLSLLSRSTGQMGKLPVFISHFGCSYGNWALVCWFMQIVEDDYSGWSVSQRLGDRGRNNVSGAVGGRGRLEEREQNVQYKECWIQGGEKELLLWSMSPAVRQNANAHKRIEFYPFVAYSHWFTERKKFFLGTILWIKWISLKMFCAWCADVFRKNDEHDNKRHFSIEFFMKNGSENSFCWWNAQRPRSSCRHRPHKSQWKCC